QILAASFSASDGVSVCVTPTRTTRPAPSKPPTRSPSMWTAAPWATWTTARMPAILPLLVAGTQHAELVALGVGQHRPRDVVALPDVDSTCTEAFEPGDLAIAVLAGVR